MLDMRTIEQADPYLVAMVRTGGGTHGDRGTLTQARLAEIVNALPGEWELQRKFATLAVNRNIVAKDLRDLVFTYCVYRDAGDLAGANQLLINPDILLNPRPKELIQASQTIFHGDATKKQGATIFANRREKPMKQRFVVTDSEAAHSLNRLFMSMIESQALMLPLSTDKSTTTFNILSKSLIHKRQEIPLTDHEARTLFILMAIQKYHNKGIRSSSLIRWYFPMDEYENEEKWNDLFFSLQDKLKQTTPSIARRLAIGPKSIEWLGDRK
jgi:hypothetical protein